MEGASFSRLSTRDNDLVDDSYFSAFYPDEEIFPISDEKYADELQLQEALYSSTIMSSRTTTTTTSSVVIKKEIHHVDVEVDTDTLKGKQKETGESSSSHSHSQSKVVYCGICMEAKPVEEMFRNKNCSHSFCDYCVGRYLASKIQENISMVKCPDPKCRGVLELEQCRSIVPKDVFDRWVDALCENVVLGSQRFYCPFKDCSAMLLNDEEEGGVVVTASECPHCNRLFCAQCKVSWHAGIGCREFQSLKEGERGREDLMVMELAKNKRWKRCPRCSFYVERIYGCSHVTCR